MKATKVLEVRWVVQVYGQSFGTWRSGKVEITGGGIGNNAAAKTRFSHEKRHRKKKVNPISIQIGPHSPHPNLQGVGGAPKLFLSTL